MVTLKPDIPDNFKKYKTKTIPNKNSLKKSAFLRNRKILHFSSYAPWRIKLAWVKVFFQWAVKMCSTEDLLNQQIKKTLFMSWNGYPNYISKALLHRLK